jgi:hypothetical protein
MSAMRNNAATQAAFCTRCETRLATQRWRAAVLHDLITRVARPWWRFIRESTMAFVIVSGFYPRLSPTIKHIMRDKKGAG